MYERVVKEKIVMGSRYFIPVMVFMCVGYVSGIFIHLVVAGFYLWGVMHRGW